MECGLYFVKDEKAGCLTPYCQHNDEVAKREFAYLFESNSSSKMAPFPNDFSLWRAGTFCFETGLITECNPVLLMRGSDVNVQN